MHHAESNNDDVSIPSAAAKANERHVVALPWQTNTALIEVLFLLLLYCTNTTSVGFVLQRSSYSVSAESEVF